VREPTLDLLTGKGKREKRKTHLPVSGRGGGRPELRERSRKERYDIVTEKNVGKKPEEESIEGVQTANGFSKNMQPKRVQ